MKIVLFTKNGDMGHVDETGPSPGVARFVQTLEPGNQFSREYLQALADLLSRNVSVGQDRRGRGSGLPTPGIAR